MQAVYNLCKNQIHESVAGGVSAYSGSHQNLCMTHVPHQHRFFLEVPLKEQLLAVPDIPAMGSQLFQFPSRLLTLEPYRLWLGAGIWLMVLAGGSLLDVVRTPIEAAAQAGICSPPAWFGIVFSTQRENLCRDRSSCCDLPLHRHSTVG